MRWLLEIRDAVEYPAAKLPPPADKVDDLYVPGWCTPEDKGVNA